MKGNWDNIKKTAQGLGSDLDSEAAWERFDKRRGKKDKPFLIWWLTGSMGLLIIVGSFSILSKNESRKAAVGKEEYIMTSVDDKSESNLINEQVVKTKTSKNNTIDQTEVFKQKKKQLSLAKINKETNDKNLKINTSQANAPSQGSTTTIVKGILSKDANPGFNKVQSFNQKSNRSIVARANTELKRLTSLNQRPQLRKISFKEVPIIWPVIPKVGLATSYIQNPKAKTPPLYALTVSTMYGDVSRQLSGELDALSLKRQLQEKFKEQVGLELRFGRSLARNFDLNIGFRIQQYRSKILQVAERIQPNVLYEDVVKETQLKEGVLSEIRGPIVGSKTLITEHTRYQRYIDLQAICLLGYSVDLSAKSYLNVAAGMAFGIMNITKGSSFESNTSIGTYTMLADLGYSEKNLLQFSGEINLGYRLNEVFDIRLGLGLDHDLNSRLNQGQLEDHFTSLTAKLGLRRAF